MSSCKDLLASLHLGAYDEMLKSLYALDGRWESLDEARNRASRVIESLIKTFSSGETAQAALFSSPGRVEIGGNHTDHQRGRVLCGSVDLDMLACAVPNGLGVVRIRSEGYPPLEIALDDLEPRPEERNTSAALVRGVAAKIAERSSIRCGFDACVTSNVLSGSGLSSSAAYEVLVANIFNHFCCEGALDAVQIARIGQYAENAYFGKPCGLMDQIGSSIGGVVAVDFADPSAPVVRKVAYDFTQSGYSLCIVDTGSCHADLTDDYADITREMGDVAACFGKKVLREISEDEFRTAIPSLRVQCGDRAVLRAIHFYADDRRVHAEAEALGKGDFATFLALVNSSGISSELYLQNAWSVSDPKQQAITLALAVGRELLEGAGAIRVHGGGFAGTIQAFVPNEKLLSFKNGMESFLGRGKCYILHIRSQGGCVIVP